MIRAMLDLSFSKPSEVVKRLCGRLRTERMALGMTQSDLAGRAGIGTNTVSNLEAGRNVGFEAVVRVAMVLVGSTSSKACSSQSWTASKTFGATKRLRTASGRRGSPVMPEQVKVFYEGWGERWHWGTLISSIALTGRPLIAFEYSNEARRRGLELSSYKLPLAGPPLRRDFPDHQLQLPGPVYDALPDGWGMLLMDRMFRRRGINAARIGPLQRLAYIGGNAMGAMTFEPVAPEGEAPKVHIPLEQLSAEVQQVLHGEGGEFLQTLLLVGGSPQGARPKALVYRDPRSGAFTTTVTPGFEAWLIKFPAREEHAEVCAIEMVYAECLRRCGIETPDTQYFSLPNGLAAFASKRFDRHDGLRVPMQSLAAFTGANYQTAGSLDYVNFLRATRLCTNDVRQMAVAFERAVFNVAFNNRDDHPKTLPTSCRRMGNGVWLRPTT